MFHFIFNSQISGNHEVLEKNISDKSYMIWRETNNNKINFRTN